MDKAKSHFIQVLSETGNVTAACQQCSVARSTAYYWRNNDQSFAEAWENAISESTDRLALEARRRALDGVEEIRYFKGEPVGTIRRYSDALLMFLLRAYRPGIYRNPENNTDLAQESYSKARDDLTQKLARLAEGDDAGSAEETAEKSVTD